MQKEKSSHIDVADLNALAGYGIRRVAAAIGVFDGVHCGHRQLIARLIAMADEKDAEPIVLTFHPHPRKILKPNEDVRLLISREKKIELLHYYGINAVVTIPFTKDFAALSAESFLSRCLAVPDVELTGICVGSNWRFGAGGRGDIHTINNFAEAGHFAFAAVDELEIDGRIVSSTAIRRAITGGLLEEAAKMLGRYYNICGKVSGGKQIAGPILSCPTANLVVRHGILPPHGVYAGRAKNETGQFPAAIAIGNAPTFHGSHQNRPIVEVHLLDFEGDLYGSELEIEFITYLREERCFPSPDKLKEQINRDLGDVRAALADPLVKR